MTDSALPRPRRMLCTCCGGVFLGRQHWNQDTGHGLGECCAAYVATRYAPEELRRNWGEPGVNWAINEQGSPNT